MRAAILCAVVSSALAQEQMHLSLTGRPNEIALDFVVHPAASTGVSVFLDSTAVPASCNTATINKYTAQFCTALFSGLAPNTKYTYKVSSSAKTSPECASARLATAQRLGYRCSCPL